ncbi:MAG: TonB-dependent receptor [Bacteroidetes bacterium]|nr:TonB-dependent receptor [Bacteroidota bacterium]
MKQLMLLLTASLLCMTVGAQSDIRGHIRDEKGKDVPDATVVLRSLPDSTLAKGAATGEKGAFVLEKVARGKYVLRVSCVGMEEYSVNLAIDSAEVALEEIVLYPKSKGLEQVTVTARKPLITRQAGKMVLNIESSVYNKGENSYRLFNVIPGVQADGSGNMQFRGQEQVVVYVDGRKVQFRGRQLMDYLRSIPSESIKSFEVSTVPGAEFEAGGSGIVVNIMLKENYKFGLTGTVYSTYEQTRYAGFTNGYQLNYRVGKFKFENSYSIIAGKGFSDNTEDQTFKNQPLYFGQVERGRERVTLQRGKLGVDYILSNTQVIGGDYELTYWDGHTYGSANTVVKKAADAAVDSSFTTDNNKTMRLTNQMANLFYRNRLDSLGSKLVVGYSYVGYNNKVTSDIYSEFFLADKSPSRSPLDITIRNPLQIDIHTGYLDLTKEYRSGYELKMGGRIQHSETDNHIFYYMGQPSGLKTLDSSRTSDFLYKENILGLYTSLAKDWGKWSVNAGVRYERSDYTGTSFLSHDFIENKRWNLFPSVFVQNKLNANNLLSFSYGRRINRPSYQVLNPFQDVEDPYFINRGNPSLVPYFSNNYELSWMLASKYNFTLSHQSIKGIINNIYETADGSNVIVSTYGNVNDQKDYGLSLSFPVDVTKWWQVSTYAYAGYTSIRRNDMGGLTREKVHTYLQLNNRFSLPGKYFVEVYGNWLYNSFYSVYDLGPQAIINLSVKKSFFGDRLTCTVGADDPFNIKRINININEAQFDRVLHNYLPIRKLSVGLSYNIQKGKKKTTREYINTRNDDAIERLSK